jgi:hypothetical protein
MQHRVGVMPGTKQKHLSVEIMHAPGRTCGNVGRKRERLGGDHLGKGSDRGERMTMAAPQHAGQSPERVRDDAEVGRGWR